MDARTNSRKIVLNVYNINQTGAGFLRAIGMGAYHSGVEINGQEWTYSESGVFYHKSKEPPTPDTETFSFKESIEMGIHDGTR